MFKSTQHMNKITYCNNLSSSKMYCAGCNKLGKLGGYYLK